MQHVTRHKQAACLVVQVTQTWCTPTLEQTGNVKDREQTVEQMGTKRLIVCVISIDAEPRLHTLDNEISSLCPMGAKQGRKRPGHVRHKISHDRIVGPQLAYGLAQ